MYEVLKQVTVTVKVHILHLVARLYRITLCKMLKIGAHAEPHIYVGTTLIIYLSSNLDINLLGFVLYWIRWSECYVTNDFLIDLMIERL